MKVMVASAASVAQALVLIGIPLSHGAGSQRLRFRVNHFMASAGRLYGTGAMPGGFPQPAAPSRRRCGSAAIDAGSRVRHGAQALLRDRSAALLATSVTPLLDTLERPVDLSQLEGRGLADRLERLVVL